MINTQLNSQYIKIKENYQKKEDKVNKLYQNKQYYMQVINNLDILADMINANNIQQIEQSYLQVDFKLSPAYQLIKKSQLIDKEYYTDKYLLKNNTKELKTIIEDIDVIEHFLLVGARLRYNPNKDFDTRWYINTYLIDSNVNPLVDYILNKEKRLTKAPVKSNNNNITDTQEYHIIEESGLFDTKWYKKEYNLENNEDVLTHYMTIGYIKDYRPYEEFDVKYYKEKYNINDENPLLDYILNMDKHTDRKDNPYYKPTLVDITESYPYTFIKQYNLIDTEEYNKNQDIGNSIDEIANYVEIGYKDNYILNDEFTKEKYQNKDEDSLFAYITEVAEKSYKYDEYDYNSIIEADITDSIEYNIILDEGLFDEEYYHNTYPEVEDDDLLVHFLLKGAKDDKNPSQYFDTKSYKLNHPNININPLYHYILSNKKELLLDSHPVSDIEDTHEYILINQSGLFDKDYYTSIYDINTNPINHFIQKGVYENKNPSEDFDTQYYRNSKEILKNSNINPLLYYICKGRYDNDKTTPTQLNPEKLVDRQYSDSYIVLSNSKYFDNDYYRKHNPNISPDDDPIDYYIKKGRYEDYPTSKYFDKKEYLNLNKDLKTYGVDPVVHYTLHGYDEKRPFKRPRLDDEILSFYPDNIREYYNTIFDSEYFDEYYYMNHYSQVEDADADPVLHYILIGVNLEYNPSRFFSTKNYLKTYNDVTRNNINPLYHYIKYGINEGRRCFLVQNEFNTKYDSKYDLLKSKDIFKQLHKKYTIIIPIYNAYEETKQCITSVLENTTLNYELILINDCSTDQRINQLLDSLEGINNIHIIHNNSNQGFVKNVNMGMKLSEDDVILLNSDTIVTPKWLSKLVISAYSDKKIATVTPITNSSDMSIPILGEDKSQHALNNIAYQTDKLSNEYLQSPTGNGFCLFIKRAVIDDIGLFDEVFGMGYGEETDFTQRAVKNGWINIRNPSVFIYHRRHASFKKDNTDKLKEKNKEIIKERYPQVFRQWDLFIESVRVQKTLENIKDNINKNINAQRILCIADCFDKTSEFDELMYLRLSRNYDTYILSIEEDSIKLYMYTEDLSILLNTWDINYSWDEDKFFKFYFNLLVNLKIDLLYVKHSPRLYKSTNHIATSYTNIIRYLEIDMIHEKKLDLNNILDVVDKRLNPIDSLENLIESKKSSVDFSKTRNVVYTAVIGSYDEPIRPSYIDENFDYICFTNNPFLKSDFWQIKMIECDEYDQIRTARMYKFLAHKYLSEYEYSLWIDSNYEITGDITDYINRYSKDKKILTITHEENNCIYTQADIYLKQKRDKEENIIKQMIRYRQEGYPENNGLVSTGILFRQHNNPEVIKLMEDCFEEVVNGSYLDTLCFNYVCWKNNYTPDISPLFYHKNVYFQRHDHLNQCYFTRKVDTPYDCWNHMKYNIHTTDKILEKFKQKVSVVIPIYNAYEETKRCIESVLEYTTIDYELLLINDCSPDKRINTLLDKYRDYSNIRIIHNNSNQGFVKNVNMAFMQTSGDVILLNSDTIVTPKWIQKLIIKAYTKDSIATVTPVSNSAGAFSVPKVGVNQVKIDQINNTANIIEKSSDDSLIMTPTANGFCMYIKRKAIYEVGFFDEIFGRGYGEENDFSMRLNKKGYHHIIDASTYIYHERSASFSHDKDKLIKHNRKILDEKHPEYKKSVDEFLLSTRLENARIRIDDSLKSTQHNLNRKRILYAIHDGSGGTLHTSIELMKNIDNSMDAYLLITGRDMISLYKYNSLGNNLMEHKDGDKEFVKYLQLLEQWPVEYEYSALDTSIEQLKMICFNLLVTLNIDIVHIRHLIYSSFDLAEVANTMGIPVILSFHDFYYICPSHNLLDDNLQYCGGHCSKYNPENDKNGQCAITSGLNIPLAKSIISTWRSNVEKLLDCCDAYVTTCQSAYDIYTEFYPKLKKRNFKIIEHGRNLQTPDTTEYVSSIKKDEKIRIVFPGHLNTAKGYKLIKSIKEYDVNDRLEYHYMGSIFGSEDLEDIGEYHGFYDRSEFEDIIHSIKPHFIAILSVWPETYCHTLTEGWASGIPVLTTKLGALKERVESNGGGFFIDTNPQKAYQQIMDIVDNHDNYMKVASQIPEITFKSSEAMGEDYLRLYQNYLK